MKLDELGVPPAVMVPWVIAVVGISIIALILVARREKSGLARVLWFLLIVGMPILAPLSAFIYYLLWQPMQSKRKWTV